MITEDEAFWAGIAVAVMMLGGGFSMLFLHAFTGFGSVVLALGLMTMALTIQMRAKPVRRIETRASVESRVLTPTPPIERPRETTETQPPPKPLQVEPTSEPTTGEPNRESVEEVKPTEPAEHVEPTPQNEPTQPIEQPPTEPQQPPQPQAPVEEKPKEEPQVVAPAAN